MRNCECCSVAIKQALLCKLSIQITKMSRKDWVEKRKVNEYGVLNLLTSHKKKENVFAKKEEFLYI